METITIISIVAAFMSILSLIISYRKINLQRRQEKELLNKLEKKSSKYFRELIKHLDDGKSISSIDEIEGRLSEHEILLRNQLFEKYILTVLKNNQKKKFSEVKDALYREKKINRHYLGKIHRNLSNQIKAHNK